MMAGTLGPCWALILAPYVEPFLSPRPQVVHVVTPVVHKHGYPPWFQLADQLLELLVRDIAVKNLVRDHVPNRHLKRLSSGLSLCIPCSPGAEYPSPPAASSLCNCSSRSFFFFSSRCSALLGDVLGVAHGHVHLRPQVGWQVTGE